MIDLRAASILKNSHHKKRNPEIRQNGADIVRLDGIGIDEIKAPHCTQVHPLSVNVKWTLAFVVLTIALIKLLPSELLPSEFPGFPE